MIPRDKLPLIRLGLLLLAGLAWRAVDLRDWPGTDYPTLEYESALAARSIWITLSEREQPAERIAWRDAVGREYFVAPPVLPAAVAVIYLAIGEEAPWVARILTAACWIGAAGLIARTIMRVSGQPAAAIPSTAWFLFCSLGVVLSLSFQTESLLALGLAAAIAAFARPRTLRWRETLATATLCGFVSLLKPGIVFAPLIAGFAAVVAPLPGSLGRKAVHLLIFAAFVAIPGTVYAKLLLEHHAGRIMPHLLGEAWFYQGVWDCLRSEIGLPGLFGVWGAAIAARRGTYWPAALILGHFATLAVFTYHAATHDYYQMPLLVFLATSSGWAMAWILEKTERLRHRGTVRAVLACGVVGYLAATTCSHLGPPRWFPAKQAERAASRRERQLQAEQATAVRAAVGPARVLELTRGYGYPLRFHGWLLTRKWPSFNDRRFIVEAGGTPAPFAARTYLGQLLAVQREDFFVVTDLDEWEKQPDLQEALAEYGPPVVARPDLIVYDLRRSRAN